jgi:hypothetical protein
MESKAAELRRSAAIRVLAAVLLAAGLTALAIHAAWGPLDVKTDVIGYPVFKNFNFYNYANAYYLAIGLFPVAALLLFLAFTRLAPRVGLAVPPRGDGLRAILRAPGEQPQLADQAPLADASETRRRAVGAARIGFIGTILGFEAGVAGNSLSTWLPLVIVAYCIVVLLGAWILGRWKWSEWSLEARLAAMNSFGALLTIAGLLVTSIDTEVTVASDGAVKHFAWLPIWLALPALAILVAVVAVALRRATSATRVLKIERRVLLLVAAPACLFLLLQVMTGDLGELDMFHNGEQLVGARLVEDGWLPWRDVVLTHGLFQDVIYTFGQAVFGNSAWGFFAGTGMIMTPLFLLSFYFLFVYLLGRNWLLLLFAALLIVGTTLVADEFRFILLPPILLLLATLFRRFTPVRAVALAFLIVVQVILTPEAVPIIPAVAAVLALYEWHWREPGSPLAASFRRTFWVAVAGVAFAALFAGYLAARGALDDYVYVSINLVHGHGLSGGIPPGPNPGTLTYAQFYFLALAPPAALLISFAYAITRIRLRRGFYVEDWVMAANAIFLVFYYPKFLDRMDTGHVYQPFVVALPLILYIVFRAVAAIERWIRERGFARSVLGLTAHPLSLAMVIVTAVLSWGTLHDRVQNARVFHHVTVTEPPTIKRVGYSQAFNTVAYRDLKQVVDAYLGPKDRLFDFSNTPLLFFYLMGRDPSTRYFHVTLAYSAKLQADLIDRLRRANPKLIVFDNDSDPFISLSNWDGIASMVRSYNVSQWILDRYRPLLWIHGFTFYARRDQPPPSQLGLHLSKKPVTRNVAFSVQPCNWGFAPTFLDSAGHPRPNAPAAGAHLGHAPDQVTVVGWAGDPGAKLPAREVIATVNGKVVAHDKPTLDRPDLVAYGLPKGFRHAGFQMNVPVVHGGTLRLFGVSRNGSLSQIVRLGGHPEKGTIPIDGREVKLQPNAVWGQINSRSQAKALQIELPSGSHWSGYRYLEVDAGQRGFKNGTFTIYDRPRRPSPGHDIIFQTLDRSPKRYVVPVGACAQWHAYRTRRLLINVQPGQQISAIRLIR